jgi:hypothetical protein
MLEPYEFELYKQPEINSTKPKAEFKPNLTVVLVTHGPHKPDGTDGHRKRQLEDKLNWGGKVFKRPTPLAEEP